jgi:hypothetical protein
MSSGVGAGKGGNGCVTLVFGGDVQGIVCVALECRALEVWQDLVKQGFSACDLRLREFYFTHEAITQSVDNHCGLDFGSRFVVVTDFLAGS